MSGRHEVDEPRPREGTGRSVEGWVPDDDERLRGWQAETLHRMGYRATTAQGLVAIAWVNGDQIDLTHRIADLLDSGANHGQAARITLGEEPIVIALFAE
jgi:hypothetical protein